MIGGGTLDWLRSLGAAFLPDAATIERFIETSGPDGVDQEWSPIATGVACRVSPIGSQGNEGATVGAVVLGDSQWVVWLPALTDVTVKDRLVITGADRPDGRTFECTRVDERSYETVRSVICRLVD